MVRGSVLWTQEVLTFPIRIQSFAEKDCSALKNRVLLFSGSLEAGLPAGEALYGGNGSLITPLGVKTINNPAPTP